MFLGRKADDKPVGRTRSTHCSSTAADGKSTDDHPIIKALQSSDFRCKQLLLLLAVTINHVPFKIVFYFITNWQHTKYLLVLTRTLYFCMCASHIIGH